ncbi:uncharacterized protein V1510DRAFT_404448 [Dipodascopsis tothii]|uniref:uncharacterized protein n=1 Tax=Dipodascopsis tothii TaxID=44089 RepID=UPI0034CD3C27
MPMHKLASRSPSRHAVGVRGDRPDADDKTDRPADRPDDRRDRYLIVGYSPEDSPSKLSRQSASFNSLRSLSEASDDRLSSVSSRFLLVSAADDSIFNFFSDSETEPDKVVRNERASKRIASPDASAHATDASAELQFPVLAFPRTDNAATRAPAGKLKVLVTGQHADGATVWTVVQAIVRACPFILHVDKAPVYAPASMLELYASTEHRPRWAAGDSAYERNICFVGAISPDDSPLPVAVQYLEYGFRATSRAVADHTNSALVAGPGLAHADVGLYLLSDVLSGDDVRLLRQLHSYLPIVPIIVSPAAPAAAQGTIAESATETTADAARKKTVLRALSDASISPFLFGQSVPDLLAAAEPEYPPCVRTPSAVESKQEPVDDGEVDPGLSNLASQLFSPDGASWLRHITAAKFTKWTDDRADMARPNTVRRRRIPGPYVSSAGAYTHEIHSVLVPRDPFGIVGLFPTAESVRSLCSSAVAFGLSAGLVVGLLQS